MVLSGVCHQAAGLRLTDPRWLHDRWLSIKLQVSGLLRRNPDGSRPALPPDFARLAFGGVAAFAGGGGRAAGRAGGLRLGAVPPCVGPCTPPAGLRRTLSVLLRGLARWRARRAGHQVFCLAGARLCPEARVAAARAVVDLLRLASSAAWLRASGGAVARRCWAWSPASVGGGVAAWGGVMARRRYRLRPDHAAAGLRLTGARGVQVTGSQQGLFLKT